VTVYTDVFGTGSIRPSQVNYRSLDLSAADIALTWPLEAAPSTNTVSTIIDITSSVINRVLSMPDASQGSNGNTTILNNIGAQTIIVKDSVGNTLLSISPGTAWTLYLYDNSTAAGSWRSFQAGASVSQAQAASLAGNGLRAIGATLSTAHPVVAFATSGTTLGATDRAKLYSWTGGGGSVNLSSAASMGNDYFVGIRNDGSGTLTVTPAGGDTVNGATTLALAPGDSAWFISDGATSYKTVGLGKSATFAFDYTSINVAGAGTYTLSGAEINRISYKFTGALTGDRTIIVPATIQQYWIDNSTTGAFNFYVKTPAQIAPGVQVAAGERAILYSDGNNVLDADTQSISIPILIAQGGTGATTAAGARANLGSTAVGDALYTAATATAARAALGSGAVGDAVFVSATQAAAQTAIGVFANDNATTIIATQSFGR
jgi:hypothetical protein